MLYILVQILIAGKGSPRDHQIHGVPPFQERGSMKQKTHSGAKKRFRVKPSGKVKRKKCNLRHRLAQHSSKRKRHLGIMTYVDGANAYQVSRLLVTPVSGH